MQKRTLKVALLAVLATVLVFGISGMVLADQTWKDLPDTVTAKYGITDNQVAGISEGFAGGLWKPFKSVTRAQFTKMMDGAFNISLAEPAIASYTDVPKGSYYYPYIEGAKAAGAVTGTTTTTFSPNVSITRQQAIAMVARYIAKAQGYDLATMYTTDEIAALLAHFGDAASVSADLRKEVAFAFDVGLTNGDDFGNLKPLANLSRIQGAALLIRAEELVPPNLWVPAKIELESADKTEGMIGQTFSATFKVTTASGHPAKGILVDFDSLGGAEFYVGNVTQQAAVTDDNGEVTVDMLSLEPGTQRVSATVAKVGTIYTTRYWLVLDEVYNVKGSSAQNNAGVEHVWGVRVVVFGPGPRSTSQNDWYNAIDASYDPTDINVSDGVDAICDGLVADDGWNYAYEQTLALLGYTPRTLAGIDVEWSIYNKPDDPKTKLTDESITSVGNIIAVDGTAITPAKTAVGKTDANGYSSITVYSEQTGKTLTKAVANYAGNPYPKQLFNHNTFQDWQWHAVDWDDQPVANAYQTKTWIAHTIGSDTSNPISPAYSAPNIGEEKTLTITLVDTYGNPVAGKSVEWFMQGVGFFQTDDSGDTSDAYVAANNKDYDVTDANGKATLFVKSYDSGEQIVHAKVRDKGTGGSEGSYITYTAEVQWFDVDIATFDDITTVGQYVYDYDLKEYVWNDNNEALSANAVSGSHTFNLHAYGLKLEYDSSIDEPDGQTSFIDSDYTGASYDGIIDWRDAAYYGGVLMAPMPRKDDTPGSWFWDDKYKQYYEFTDGKLPYDANGDGIIEAHALVWTDTDADGQMDAGELSYVDERGTAKVKVAGIWLTLSFEGAYTMYDYDDDGYKEPFTGRPGIYMPLAGKSVYFYIENEEGTIEYGGTTHLSNLGAYFDGADVAAAGVPSLGTITPKEGVAATTDATGTASVTVTATNKGPETIKGIVDWTGNPHNRTARISAYAKKNWTAGTTASASDVTIEVYIDGIKVASNKKGEIAEGYSATWVTDPNTGYYDLNSAHVDVHVLDAYGNDLPDYEVVYLLEDINSWLGGSQNAQNTYIPWAYLVDLDPSNDALDAEGNVYDQNGTRPDADEPSPASDPYAYIVGPGYTGGPTGSFYTAGMSFFFNQWLGSEKPTDVGQAGLASWWTRLTGEGFEAYYGDKDHISYTYAWPRWPYPVNPDEVFNGFDLVLEDDEPTAPDTIGLATDGAKAWTLDGFYDAGDGDIEANLLTGSNIDIQLADDVSGAADEGVHLKSILRVMVYAPANGLVEEGTPIWSFQVHQIWEEPVPTTITLTPTSDYAIAGMEETQLVATVYDQFDDPMPGVDVSFDSIDSAGVAGSALEGTLNSLFDADVVITDENGNAAESWGQNLGNWGVEKVVASAGDITSDPALIQWIYVDGQGTFTTDDAANELVAAYDNTTKVIVSSGFDPWNGDVLKVFQNPGDSTALGKGTYVYTVPLNISTITMTWTAGKAFFVFDSSSTNKDGVPNWVYDIVQ